jgi:uncharacterized protein (TIGR03067 family)
VGSAKTANSAHSMALRQTAPVVASFLSPGYLILIPADVFSSPCDKTMLHRPNTDLIPRGKSYSSTAFCSVLRPEADGLGQPPVIAMELKGKWAVTSVKSSGTILSEDEEITVVWEFRTRQLEITLVSAEGRRSRSVIYPITTDPAQRPKHLDASSPLNQKLGFTGIYKIEGDILTICWNVGVFRPQAFESSPSDGFTITTLQRQPDEAEVDQVRINPPQD